MRDDFGYMEEGKLGKPYNVKILKRLLPYSFPYKKIILASLCLALVISVFDLALPYLSKVAIDRYILSSWYLVKLSDMEENDRQEFLKEYGKYIEKSEEGSYGIISHVDLKDIDVSIVNSLRAMDIISQERLYKLQLKNGDYSLTIKGGDNPVKLAHGYVLVPLEEIHGLNRKDIQEIRGKDLRGLLLLGLGILGLILLTFIINYYEYFLLEFIGQNIMQDIRVELFKRMQTRAISFFERFPVGTLVTRVTNDIENLNEMFKSVIVAFFKDIFILVGILVVLLYLNWRLALVSFIILPFIFGFTLLFSSLAREVFREMRSKVAKINAFLQERFSGMRIIQLYAREQVQIEKFIKINHENYLAGMKQIRIFAVFMPLMELFSSITVALIIWYGGGKVVSDQLSLGSLVAFISYIQMFFKPIRDISEKYNIMQLAMASSERIIEFMDNGEEIPEPSNPETPGKKEGHLQFKNVSFSYKEGRPVLEDVSFEVKPGETVAIVGATGAGKTTVVSLIERFYDVDKGAILLDGVDIRKLSKTEVRSRIGLVMQDVFIFSGSLMDNIIPLMGERDEGIAIEAAKNANALQFIEKLPHKFQQELSEGGSTISGGERQLLSFARALAYKPKLLILDEATSSVDPETEQLIQDAISRMTRKQTTLVVAHRLSTIRDADHILVMHHGHIQEEGNHDELMAKEGIYYKLNKFHEYNH
ncbi:ABC transporter ATP-binding protein [Thermodesulfobacteriota bacterium]